MPDTGDSGTEVARYQFIPDATACDICQSMEGEYEDAPHVPIHKNCECQVVRLGGAGDDCTYEIIDLTSDEEFYDETQNIASIDFGGPLAADTDVSVDVHYGTESYSFDEGVQEAAEEQFGWSAEEHTARISQTVPAGTTSVEVEIQFRMGTTIFRGERRRACSAENPDGSVTTTYDYLGSVGGMVIESTDIESFDIQAEAAGSGDYFDDDDEVPT